jgi:Glucodextranase, domain B/Bacterial Ig-like domain (group 1)
MTTRRGSRPSHVRPRPPSGGRSTPVKVRPRAPAPGRLSVHAPVRRSRGIPLVGRLALGAGVLAVAVLVLYVGAGGLSVVAGALGSTLTNFVQGVTATPVPSELAPTAPEAPTIESPAEPYTNQTEVDLTITVPSRLAGDPDYLVRVYLALKDQAPTAIDERPLAPTPRMIIPVTLTKGINDFSVTLVGPGGESESSPLARWVLDTTAPAIRLISPKDGALINRKAVALEGRTQGRSTLQIRNTKTGESIGGTAASDGTFSLSVPLTSGTNPIRITATDPAGNSKALEVSVRRGSGRLRASLSGSFYSVSQKSLPIEIRLTVLVDDPDGKPLAGARVTFTLSVPGVKTVTGDAVTDANGQASYTTRIPKGADRGGGTAGVLVRTTDFGRTTDETVVNITK